MPKRSPRRKSRSARRGTRARSRSAGRSGYGRPKAKQRSGDRSKTKQQRTSERRRSSSRKPRHYRSGGVFEEIPLGASIQLKKIDIHTETKSGIVEDHAVSEAWMWNYKASVFRPLTDIDHSPNAYPTASNGEGTRKIADGSPLQQTRTQSRSEILKVNEPTQIEWPNDKRLNYSVNNESMKIAWTMECVWNGAASLGNDLTTFAKAVNKFNQLCKVQPHPTEPITVEFSAQNIAIIRWEYTPWPLSLSDEFSALAVTD